MEIKQGTEVVCHVALLLQEKIIMLKIIQEYV